MNRKDATEGQEAVFGRRMSKPMTCNEVCRFREQCKQVTTLTAALIAEAERICDEFGEGFNGIRARVNWVKREFTDQGRSWRSA